MRTIDNFHQWKRTNKVLLILAVVFFFLAPVSGYSLWRERENSRVESASYRVWTDSSYGYTGYNSYDAKTDILGVLEAVAPITCLIASGVFGVILWRRKPNDILDKE